MRKTAILLASTDNCATCTENVSTRDRIFLADQPDYDLIAAEDIPMWHKIALTDIKKGEYVRKYGEVIGEALEDIEKGSLINHENIQSVKRDYSAEYIEE